jgi:hypothetical protein
VAAIEAAAVTVVEVGATGAVVAEAAVTAVAVAVRMEAVLPLTAITNSFATAKARPETLGGLLVFIGPAVCREFRAICLTQLFYPPGV